MAVEAGLLATRCGCHWELKDRTQFRVTEIRLDKETTVNLINCKVAEVLPRRRHLVHNAAVQERVARLDVHLVRVTRRGGLVNLEVYCIFVITIVNLRNSEASYGVACKAAVVDNEAQNLAVIQGWNSVARCGSRRHSEASVVPHVHCASNCVLEEWIESVDVLEVCLCVEGGEIAVRGSVRERVNKSKRRGEETEEICALCAHHVEDALARREVESDDGSRNAVEFSSGGA